MNKNLLFMTNQLFWSILMITILTSCDGGTDPIDNPNTSEVITTEISNISQNSAQTGGTIIYSGTEQVVSRGVCYGTNSIPTIYGSSTFDGQGTGQYTTQLTGLFPSTTYYVRAYAFIGDSAHYGSILQFETEGSSVNYGSMTDIEGNEYRTITLGTQTWMADNLRTEKYKDGTEIPLVEDSMSWYLLTTPAYCYYHNNEAVYKATMGALYNYYATEADQLCPDGWHIPSKAEWQTLLDYLSSSGYNYDGTTVSNKVAVAMSTWEGWGYSTGMGCPGNDDYQFMHNASGFSARPAGYRIPMSPIAFGSYIYLGAQTSWWSDEFNESLGNTAVIDNLSPMVAISGQMKAAGKSVRCIKN
jgi:uncharacterized protein (TIGR02145 family)